MLTKEENERMCRVGPGTATGTALRRYWLPALSSQELPEPDCPPVRVQLLGEDFVAFRDTEGRVGILDEYCAHRGASLVLGRVEDCGIRCIYHGWKFGVDGTIQEAPNVPNPTFRQRVKAPAYPVQEVGGVIWVYLGPKDLKPVLPTFRFMDVDTDHRIVVPVVVNCNYVQIIEGAIDSSHLNILHQDALAGELTVPSQGVDSAPRIRIDSGPRVEVENTTSGFHYAAIRRSDEDESNYVRVTAFIAPVAAYVAPDGICLFAVPMADDRTLFLNIFYNHEQPINTEPFRSKQLSLLGLSPELLTRLGMTRATCDLPGIPCRANNFFQDRAAMAEGKTFTGIANLTPEDQVVTQSMGPIFDRSKEHVVAADGAVIRLRRLLLHCADIVEQGGDPIGVNVDISKVRANAGTVAPDERWQHLVPENGGRDGASW